MAYWQSSSLFFAWNTTPKPPLPRHSSCSKSVKYLPKKEIMIKIIQVQENQCIGLELAPSLWTNKRELMQGRRQRLGPQNIRRLSCQWVNSPFLSFDTGLETWFVIFQKWENQVSSTVFIKSTQLNKTQNINMAMTSGNTYILFDGLTYNMHGYFASCVVFSGQGKIQAMSKMSASIIC